MAALMGTLSIARHETVMDSTAGVNAECSSNCNFAHRIANMTVSVQSNLYNMRLPSASGRMRMSSTPKKADALNTHL